MPSGRDSETARRIASAPWSIPPPSRMAISAPPPLGPAPVAPPRLLLQPAASAPAAPLQCPVPPLRILRTTAALCTEAPARSCGSAADICSTPVPTPGEARKSAESIARAAGTCSASEPVPLPPPPPPPRQPPQPLPVQQLPAIPAAGEATQRPSVPGTSAAAPTNPTPVLEVPAGTVTLAPAMTPVSPPPPSVVVGMSPRLEMRLALNNDIMGDEDLICYDPGPDLASILGHDLSTFHRFTGRDLISRTASRVQPKEACISFSQQRNSKMDTPTPSRRKPSPSTWNSSASADPGKCL